MRFGVRDIKGGLDAFNDALGTALWALNPGGALIYGGVAYYDHATFLSSILAEALFTDEANSPWLRLEVLQRTPNELGIVAAKRPLLGQGILVGTSVLQTVPSLALLGSRRSGVVVSSIVHRDQARIYVKRLHDGEAEIELSPEEQAAVDAALAPATTA